MLDNRAAPSLQDFVYKDDLVLHGIVAETSTFDLVSSSSLSVPATRKPSASPLPSPLITSPPMFVDDELPTEPLSPLLSLATLTHSNAGTLLSYVSSFDSLLPELRDSLRPGWDNYFMLLASLASLRSNCMKRRVGAVLVRERRVVSTGYNGTPRGVVNCGEGGCGRCNGYGDGLSSQEEVAGTSQANVQAMGHGLNECLCLHAEENALLEAGRERVSGGGVEGAILYCNTYAPLLSWRGLLRY